MRKYAVQIITVLAGLLGVILLFQPNIASAGQSGGGGGYPTTTTKVTYPTTTQPKEPTTTRPPHETTTTYPHQTTTTRPHQTTTTQPEMTTTTQPAETTTTEPETTTTAPAETTTTEPNQNLTLLSLRAIVIGGPATPADFDLFASGPIDINGITDNPNVTFRVVDPGSYALSFVADALANDPYTNAGWDCVGSASTTTESVTLDAGEDALCVITFQETAAAVTTTTAPAGATTTVPGAPTTAPTGTTVPGQTTPGGPGTVTPGQPTSEVQTITPASEAPILTEPTGGETTLASTGYDTRLGLSSGLFMIMAGGIVLMAFRRFRR